MIKLGDQFGYIDKEGHIVINPQFKTASPFRYGMASIEVDGKWGLINKQGQFIVNPQFESMSIPLSDNLVLAQSNSKWGGIDRKGQFTFNPQFDGIFLSYARFSHVKNQQEFAWCRFAKKITTMIANDSTFNGVTYGTSYASLGGGPEDSKTFVVDQDYYDGLRCKSITIKSDAQGRAVTWVYEFKNYSGASEGQIAGILSDALANKLNLTPTCIEGEDVPACFANNEEVGKLSYKVSYIPSYWGPLSYDHYLWLTLSFSQVFSYNLDPTDEDFYEGEEDVIEYTPAIKETSPDENFEEF